MKKILLIEDNLEVRENTAEILELANYQVYTAENGKIGVELAKKEMPDLIICDIMMPELDGYGVLHILSKTPSTASIPFIFLTAKSEKDDFRKGMNLGADDYLTKPFDDLALLDAIEMRLAKSDRVKQASLQTTDSNKVTSISRGLEDLDKLIKDERKLISIKKKHTVFSQGSHPHALYYINEGKIKTFKTNEEGRELITGLHNAGEFIGYIDLLKESTYTESATALEDSKVTMIGKQDFFSLLHQNHEVSGKFIKLLTNNVVDKEDRLIKLAYNSVRKRVAESLLLMQSRYEKENDVANGFPVSREDLSALTGASKETVIRTLSDFKDEKLIDVSGKTIRIVNKTKLEKMKN